MSSVRETDSRQDALRERLHDPVYARAYRAYVTSLAQRVRATMAAGGVPRLSELRPEWTNR